MFLGVTPEAFRSHLAVVWREARPARVHVGCAGRFTAVCALIQAGATPKSVSAVDVALLPAVIGELAAGRKVSKMGLNLEGAEPFRAHAGDEHELGAAVLIAAKFAQMGSRNLYERALRDHILVTAGEQVAQVARGLRRLTDVLGGIEYATRDIRDELARYEQAGKNELVFLAMPTYVGGYEKMFSTGEERLGWEGVVSHGFDETLRETVHERLRKAKALVVSLCEYNADVAPGWQVVATLRKKPGRVDYLVANRKTYRRAYDRRAAEQPVYRRLPVYDDHELHAGSVVHLESLDEPTALHYRGVFVHRLGATRTRIYLGCFVDGQLFAVIGVNPEWLQRGARSDVFEHFGVCMLSRYQRLARLMSQLLSSGETRTYLETTQGGFVAVEAAEIRSVMLSRGPVGKSDQRGAKVLSSERQANGTWEIYYSRPFRADTWADTFAHWLRLNGRRQRAAA